MLCQELMNRHVFIIKEETPCREIMRLLAEDPSRPLVVVNDADFLLGVVTARDFLQVHLERTRLDPMAAASPDEDDASLRATMQRIANSTARDLMANAPIVAQVDTAAISIIVPMVEQRLNFVPVVEDGKIVGVIGRSEILRWMLGMMS